MPDSTTNGRRGLWSGTITFGLVSVPVSLFPAVRGTGTGLRMLSPEGTPLERRFFCPRDEREVSRDEIVRGYEIEDDTYIVVTDEELDSLAPEKSRDIDLRRFVDRDAIAPVYFDRPYFLAPGGDSTKAYRLLASAMEESGRAGIATFVMRGKEYLVAIIAEDGILRAETLRFHDEIRSFDDIPAELDAEPDPAAVKDFRKAIRALSERGLDPDELRDRRDERMEALVRRKRESGEDVVAATAAADGDEAVIIDLMEALKRRMAGARETGEEDTPSSLADWTRDQLYERAQELDIPGRSKMSKAELVEAIEGAPVSRRRTGT